ncbi:VOC family protein [Pseudobutyrivibrio sp.]|jgi:glyoxylase I family protein|uniref:VOC family protein n=1 Tax=Pseudobutyrivibrio sp. TaxID=2014367 RepID=UPI0025E0512D|nr:VOC family protein [Pseudobutyrivibrio sp.]
MLQKENIGLIKGIHHISMKCETEEELVRVKEFYMDILGLKICREWDGGLMLDTGNGLIEIFTNQAGEHQLGVIRHMALLTEDVDGIVIKVREAGYEVFVEPNDVDIPANPVYPIRMAFCYGPLGEQIEFFCER